MVLLLAPLVVAASADVTWNVGVANAKAAIRLSPVISSLFIAVVL